MFDEILNETKKLLEGKDILDLIVDKLERTAKENAKEYAKQTAETGEKFDGKPFIGTDEETDIIASFDTRILSEIEKRLKTKGIKIS